MARNTTISLGDHFAEFIDEQVRPETMALPAMSFAPGCASLKSRRQS